MRIERSLVQNVRIWGKIQDMYFARIYRIDLLTIPTHYVTIVKTYSDKKVHKTLKKNRKKERENF